MNYILATFSSRNETLAFARLVGSNGMSTQIINTPSMLSGQGCSISVRLPGNALALAQRLLSSARFQTFKGFYIAYYQNGRMMVEKVA